MILSSLKDTFVFLSSGNLNEKLSILLLKTCILSCWNISKLTVSYSFRFFKNGFGKKWTTLDWISKLKSKKTKRLSGKSN
jgi:hypothetical protein